MALTWGGLTYPWSDWREILLLTVAGVGFVVFAFLQVLRPSKATVPARVIRQRSVAFACVVAVAISASFMVVVYYLLSTSKAYCGQALYSPVYRCYRSSLLQ